MRRVHCTHSNGLGQVCQVLSKGCGKVVAWLIALADDPQIESKVGEPVSVFSFDA